MRRISTLLLCLALVACSAGFGDGDLPPAKADDRSLDLSGTDQPATLETVEDAAKAAAALTGIVDATAEVADVIGDAVGDLFPSEDNPCPDGGSASSDLGGSLNHPRIRMEFHDCVRGEYTLDGIATIRCDDLSGSECRAGQATLGEAPTVLLLRDATRQVLMRGNAQVNSDKGAGRIAVLATLEGELRSLRAEGPRWSFATQNLSVDLQDTGEQTEMRISGIAGAGGGADGASCMSGRIDSETPDEPLILKDRALSGGRLRLHSPPPRPGAQQAEAVYDETGATFTAADGGSESLTREDLAQRCSVQ